MTIVLYGVILVLFCIVQDDVVQGFTQTFGRSTTSSIGGSVLRREQRTKKVDQINHNMALFGDDYLSSLSTSSTTNKFSPTLGNYEHVMADPPLSSPYKRRIDSLASNLQRSLKQETSSTKETQSTQANDVRFYHAPKSFFTIDKLTGKGPRANADVGEPHDATRPLVKNLPTSHSEEGGSARCGSWWCDSGGWPSPKQRTTTEIFLVWEGRGCLTDKDGFPHNFYPGDVVILPKGWSGRWDIFDPIHKIWAVNDHPHVEEDPSDGVIRVRIIPSKEELIPPQPDSIDDVVLEDALYSTTPIVSTNVVYVTPSTQVGGWKCSTKGSFPVINQSMTECFHVLEGTFFLTNASDNTAIKCQAGDTVAIPQGWSGYYDIVEEPVTKLWVTAT